jgi:gluconate 2-dehydrogenase gamma chain
MTTSRRDFLSALALTGGGLLAADLAGVRDALAHAAAVRDGLRPPRFDVLTAEEAAEVTAIAARILPTTDTPGATEAGAIHFIDRALGGFAAGGLPDLRAFLADLARRAGERRPGTRTFRALPVADQDAILVAVEDTPAFGQLRGLTMMGTFGDPARGGNRDEVGWKLLGYEHRPVHAPPFGYYDEEYARGIR